MGREIQAGDKVIFSRNFMRSIAMYATNDPLAFRDRAGRVDEIRDLGGLHIAHITDANGEARRVNVANLIHVGTREAE